MKPSNDHIHVPDDGRGYRDVFVNGRLIEKPFFADTKRGIVDAYRHPFQVDKRKKRALTYRIRGIVTVVQRASST